MAKRHKLILVWAGAALLVVLGAPPFSWAAIKLFLKDGTYQLVKIYEVRRGRVRFYSVERSDWEEIPASLVDFEATRRAEEEEKAEQKKELEEAKEIEKEKFDRPGETGFQIAPGIRLPVDEGVYAFDGARVIRLIQTSGEVVKDKKRAALLLAVPGPILKNRAIVVLPSPRAAVRISAPQPVFYAQFADGTGARLQLLAVKPSKQARVVEKVDWRAGIGKPKPEESRSALEVERAEIAPGIFKLRPVRELALGEYALGEINQEKLNIEVWDFGIDGSPARNGGGENPPRIRRSRLPPQN